MPSHLMDIFLVILLLTCGTGLYFILQEFTNISNTLDVMIAASSRILSLLFYRFYAPEVQGNPTWLVFEWVIPGFMIAELILVACGSAPGDGESSITNFGSFNSNLYSALCIWSTNPYVPYYQTTFILFISDIITFLFLASLFDATRLGPFGTLHFAIIEMITAVAAQVVAARRCAARSSDQTPLPSRSSRWFYFWTGRTSDPVVPLTVPADNVSPPPYTVSGLLFKYLQSLIYIN